MKKDKRVMSISVETDEDIWNAFKRLSIFGNNKSKIIIKYLKQGGFTLENNQKSKKGAD